MGNIEFTIERARAIVRGNDARYLRVENKWINEKKGIDTIYAIVKDTETGRFYKTVYDYGRKWTTGKVVLPFDWDKPIFIEVKPKIVQKTVWEEIEEDEVKPKEEPKPQNPTKGRQPPKFDLIEEMIKIAEQINRENPDDEPLIIPKRLTER